MTEKTFALSRRRGHTVGARFRYVVAGLLALFALVLLVAPMVGGVRWAPLAVLVSARHIIVPALLIGAVLWLVVAFLRKVSTREKALAAGSVAALLVSVLVLSAAAHTVTPAEAGAKPAGDLRVLIWNTNQDAVSAETVAGLVASTHPDVVVLPEYFGQIAPNLTSQPAMNGYELYWSESSAASLLVNRSLGEYKVDTSDTPDWAGFEAMPVDPMSISPALVIAHLEHAGLLQTTVWNEHLNWVASACAGSNVIAAGDFNTSAENLTAGSLGECSDAATQVGQVATATWPTELPAQFGIQIDRVMAGSQWRAVSYQVIGTEDAAGSDHRPVLVDLSRVGS